MGIARFQPLPEQAADDDLTKTGCVLGTVDYMAPEQAMNTRRADHRADIYSLGCTLYFLLTGQPVFGGETVMERIVAHREHPVPSLRKACPAAPPWLDGVFRKMVAKKPEDRYQSATALVSDLERHAAPRSWRWLWIMVVVALVVAVGAWGMVGTLCDEPLLTEARTAEAPRPAREADLADDRRVSAHRRALVRVGGEGHVRGRACSMAASSSPRRPTRRATQTVSWRAEGKISKSGHITAKLVHTQPHPPDQWLPQTRTAVLEPDGKSIHGYAAWEGGGSQFNWELREPREAEEKELSQ